MRYRSRLLNASNARRYALSLDPDPSGTGLPFLQIGADASLMPAPVPVAEVVLSQSERADVVVDFARVPVGQTVTMHNGLSSGGRGLVMQFRVVGTASDTAPVVVMSPEGERGASLVDAPWKNTVDLDNGGTARLLIRFDGYRGRYVFHCHNLEHEDMWMMATIEVV